jgi:hypothetical protein
MRLCPSTNLRGCDLLGSAAHDILFAGSVALLATPARCSAGSLPSRNKVNTLPPIEFQRGCRLRPKVIRFEVRSLISLREFSECLNLNYLLSEMREFR